MARCTVCAHPDRDAIEDAIVRGEGTRAIGKRHGLVHDAVRRHTIRHLAPAMKQEMEVRGRDMGVNAIDRVEELYSKAEKLLADAESDGQRGLQLGALKELRQIVELLARLTGDLDNRPQVNVLNLAASPEWMAVQAQVVQALMPYPQARAAVAEVLEGSVI